MTLGRRIISGGTRWGTLFKINGEWSYIPLYWEWLEDVLVRSRQTLNKAHIYDAVSASLYTYDRNADVMRAFCEGWCPQTNTLHTSLGEMSISLWDLYRLGGLPIFGRLYDEAIPCYEELTGSDETERFIPKSCDHLFAAFHLLNSKKEGEVPRVLASNWVNFWCKYEMKYPKPPSRRTKRLSRAIKTHNPDGSLNKIQGWSKCGKKPFIELKIEDELWEETYLAALLSC